MVLRGNCDGGQKASNISKHQSSCYRIKTRVARNQREKTLRKKLRGILFKIYQFLLAKLIQCIQ